MGWFDEKDTAFIHISTAIRLYIRNGSEDQGNTISSYSLGV